MGRAKCLGNSEGPLCGPWRDAEHSLIRVFVHSPDLLAYTPPLTSAIDLSWRWGGHCQGEQAEGHGEMLPVSLSNCEAELNLSARASDAALPGPTLFLGTFKVSVVNIRSKVKTDPGHFQFDQGHVCTALFRERVFYVSG